LLFKGRWGVIVCATRMSCLPYEQMSKSKLELALELAEQGFAVFPLAPNTKTPILRGWPKRATTDAEMITKWWSKRGSKNNIGIACQDKFVVIDVDIKKGEPGAATLKEMVKDGLPQTFTVQTTTGGLHLYYQHPGGHINSVSKWKPGIDIRGNGGMAVAPGTTIEGKSYTVINTTKPVALCAKYITELPRPEDKVKGSGGAAGVFGFGNTSSLISGDISPYSELPENIPHGGRDDFIFKSACSWRERGYTLDHAQVLMRELHSRCEQVKGDEFSLDDAYKKLDQAWKTYKPSDSWTQVVAPEGDTVVAPTEHVKHIKDALKRFLLSIKLSQVIDLSRQPRYAVMSMDEFKNAFKNVWISQKQLPALWLANKNRQTVRDTTYYPKEMQIIEKDNERFYNLYTPSNQELPKQFDPEKIKLIVEHMKFLMGSKEATQLFINWCAVTTQKPWARIPWAPLIITKPRTGKGWIYLALQKVLGAHNTAKIGPDDISERKSGFNEWGSGTLLVCLDEMQTTHKWDAMERLKPMMTEPTIMINHKHGKKSQEDVFFNLLCFSNHSDAAALDEGDGRFWVIFCRQDRKSQSYYDELFDWLDGDGPAHLELWLKQINIESFSYNAPPPMTEAKKTMIDEARSPMEILIRDAIEDREGPFRADIVDINLVTQFVKETQDKSSLSHAEVYQLRHIFVSLSESLAQERYHVQFDDTGKGGKRYRCRSVRNHSKWYDCAPKIVAVEHKKAWFYLQGREFTPDLEEVKSND